MKALVWRGGNLLALESIPEPESGPGEVVVQVVLAGICGSDLHAYRGHDTARTPPLVLGHEAVARTPNGSRAAIYPLIGCGACDACRRGHYAYEHGDFDAAISLLATAPPQLDGMPILPLGQGAEALRRMTSGLDTAVKVLLRASPEAELPREVPSPPATAVRRPHQPASPSPLT
jgi:hypothetical protein